MKLFVYEEDVHVAEMLQIYLTVYLGHEVHMFQNEKEALSNIRVSYFDYYILCHWCFRSLEPFLSQLEKSKVIINTTSSINELQESLKSHKVLYKPFNLEELDSLLV